MAAYDFGMGTPNQWGVGNNGFNFNTDLNANAFNNWGVNPSGQSGLFNPSLGNGGNAFTSSIGANGSNSGLFGIQGLGANLPSLQLGMQGIGQLASLYTGLKALGLAQDQYNTQKQFAQKNLANSVQSYNTALTDKATARGVAEGQSNDQVQSYINANKLSA